MAGFFVGRVVRTMIIYYLIEAKQPEVLAELHRRHLLYWTPDGETEVTVVVDGRPYRDVTAEAIAAAVGAGTPPGHDAYRREHGRLRQVRWA
ncbi:MAG: hypothetical protein QME79_12230 [Bacillota bacterium]|nr:hypothetical protein [Bacillota bacterium]